MVWDFTKINTVFCTWYRAILDKSINSEKSGSIAALEQEICRCWLTAGSLCQRWGLAGMRANHILRCSISSWSKEVIIPLYSVWLQPHIQCCVRIWALEFKMDAKVFECIQKRAIEVVKRLEGVSCEVQVRTLAWLIWRAGSWGVTPLLPTASWRLKRRRKCWCLLFDVQL